jgi:hypothetical protein
LRGGRPVRTPLRSRKGLSVRGLPALDVRIHTLV